MPEEDCHPRDHGSRTGRGTGAHGSSGQPPGWTCPGERGRRDRPWSIGNTTDRGWYDRATPALGRYGSGMARRPPTAGRDRPAAPAEPSGVLFFVHGANETSEGLAENLARIEDQVRARGWDVTVVAPEWRRAIRPASRRRGRRRSTAAAGRHRCRCRSCAAGVRKDAVMKIVDELLRGSARGADRRARRRRCWPTSSATTPIATSIHAVLTRGARRAAAEAAGGRPVLPVALSLGGIALVDLLAELARGAGRGVRHGRLAGAAAVHLRCDPVDAVRRGRPAAPAGAVAEHLRHAATSCRSSPSRSSGARTGSPAWSTCGSGRARTSRSRTARTGSCGPVWDAIATAFTWRRVEPLTVREARRLGFEARVAPIAAGVR